MNNKILANVGGLPITEKDVDDFLLELGQRGQSYNTPEGRAAILNQLVSNKLLLLDARRNLYEADPVFREQLARLKDRLLVNFAADKAVSAISVTEDDVKKYYEEHIGEFLSEESVTASHILVETEEAALDILNKIQSGELSFADAAREYSSCPSKQNGGSLGEFGRGQMVPEFDQAVFAMEVGAITSTPVKTQFGYHLIRLDAKKPSEQIPYEKIADKLKAHVLTEKQSKAYESKINQLKILYPVDML